MPQYRFPGLVPGDRWCVTAINWLRAYDDGRGRAGRAGVAPTSGRSTSSRSYALQEHAVDVPADPGALEDVLGGLELRARRCG